MAAHLDRERLLPALRSALPRQRRTVVIFAGSQGNILRALFGDRRSAFYRFDIPLERPDVPRGACVDDLAAKFETSGRALTPTAAAILDATSLT